MGDVGIKDFLETYNLLPTYVATAEVYMCNIDSKPELSTSEKASNSTADIIEQLASELRARGVNVALDSTGRKSTSKFKLQ